MKRLLLLFLVLSLTQIGFGQAHVKDVVTLNEIYTDPGSGYNEFIELYNSSLRSVNMDDYTLLLWYETASTYGFYVLDLPRATVTRDSFYILASAGTFYAQANVPLTS